MSDTTAPDTAPQTETPAAETQAAPPADDKQDALAAALARIEALEATARAAQAAAEEARKASMTEAERIAEERKAIDSEKAAMLEQARKDAASKLGILDKALKLAPEVDPRTADGAKALADWAKANPEFVKAPIAPPPALDVPSGSRLEKILKGEIVDPYMSAETARKLLTARN